MSNTVVSNASKSTIYPAAVGKQWNVVLQKRKRSVLYFLLNDTYWRHRWNSSRLLRNSSEEDNGVEEEGGAWVCNELLLFFKSVFVE